MYIFKIDGELIHSVNVKSLKIFNPKIELEQNAFGSFEFNIDQMNPMYNKIKKMKSLFEIYQDNDLILSGRITEDGDDTYKIKNIYGEGELSFFRDSIQEPYSFQGSVEGFLEYVLNVHNDQVEEFQRFKLGNVTVKDPNDYITRSDTQYLTTWETIKKKLIELLGGYIVVRHEPDGRYIDYLIDYTTVNSQTIEFGKNMTSIKRNNDGIGIATAIMPLGAKLENSEERLTIESVNNGSKILRDEAAIKDHGRITKPVFFDDVTLPENLMSKGLKVLAEAVMMISSIEINASDNASVKENIHSYKMTSKIHAVSHYHNIDEYYVPLKMTIHPFKPEGNKITLNEKKKTLTGSSSDSENQMGAIIEKVENIQNNYNTNVPNMMLKLEQELLSAIEQTASDLTMTVSEKYYSKEGTDELISSLTTILTQTKEYFEMQFNSFSQDLGDLLEGTNANFEDIRKYIRFIEGNIILGQVGNEYSLQISKEKVSFLQGVQEIAYISNSKMYNTVVEVLKLLQIGNFGFTPRKTGNVSFKRLKGGVFV